jgi:hypothetical protein
VEVDNIKLYQGTSYKAYINRIISTGIYSIDVLPTALVRARVTNNSASAYTDPANIDPSLEFGIDSHLALNADGEPLAGPSTCTLPTAPPHWFTGGEAVFPNPFTGSINICFDLNQNGTVSFEIFDLQGKLVNTITANNLLQGFHMLSWDGKDRLGRETVEGIYFAKINRRDKSTIHKLIRVR